MGRYDALSAFLAARPTTTMTIEMTFGEVEALVGPLPPSARTYRAWWANDSKVEAHAWRKAGWHVRALDQIGERVTFARGTIGGSHRSATPSSTSVGQHATLSAAQPATVAAADSSVTEAAVQSAVVTHLVQEGWRIQRVADTASKERGIDVLATREGRTLAVEVKGLPSKHYADPRRAGETKPTSPSTQARHWYAQAVLTAMLTRNDHPDYDIAIAVPDTLTYRALYQRTSGSLRILGIQLLFVTTGGHVITG